MSNQYAIGRDGLCLYPEATDGGSEALPPLPWLMTDGGEA